MNLPPPHPLNRAASPDPRHRGLLKLAILAALLLLSLVPLSLIRGVLADRRHHHQEAIENITSTWGHPQVIAGPVLMVPYRREVKSWTEQLVNGRLERIEAVETVVARGSFLPVELAVNGQLEPDRLHRGIYEAVVYRTALRITGRFAQPSLAEWKVAPEDVLWEDAVVVVAITDLRGAKETLALKWGGEDLPLVPGPSIEGLGTTLQARLGDLEAGGGPVSFELEVNLAGSRSLSFAPFGMQNRVRLTSSYPDPSFNGAFLPETRRVTADGFEADWQVSYYGRGYPQQWSDQERNPLSGDTVARSLFGVEIRPVLDRYRYVERSIKYGLLFLVLVFTGFFLFEMRSLQRVHPLQYALVGAALCLFYLALLSLSELLPFGWAYLLGALVATGLISGYSAAVLSGGRRAWPVAGGVAIIYALLYVILRQQDYALLYGTGALFVALALAMYVTRNLQRESAD